MQPPAPAPPVGAIMHPKLGAFVPVPSTLATHPDETNDLWEKILQAGRDRGPVLQRGWNVPGRFINRMRGGRRVRASVPAVAIRALESDEAHSLIISEFLPNPNSEYIREHFIDEEDLDNLQAGKEMKEAAIFLQKLYAEYRDGAVSKEDDRSKTVFVEFPATPKDERAHAGFRTMCIIRNSGMIIPADGWDAVTYYSPLSTNRGAPLSTPETGYPQISHWNAFLECAKSPWVIYARQPMPTLREPIAMVVERANPRFLGDEFLLKPAAVTELKMEYTTQLGAFAVFHIPFSRPVFTPYTLVTTTLLSAAANRPTNFIRRIPRERADDYNTLKNNGPARIGEEATLSSCVMCGGPKEGAWERDKICSEACLEQFESVHSPTLIKQGIRTDSWSYLAKATAAVHCSEPIGDEAQDAERFKRSVDNFTRLKQQMDALSKESDGAKAGNAQIQEWIGKFDGIMRNLDTTLSDDFPRTLLSHVDEFHALHNGTTRPTASMGQIRGLLNDILRAMPVGKLAEDQRVLIEKILSRKLPNRNRLILTLDGGGMRGVVTLLALRDLLAEIRRLTGNLNLRIDDCFDLLVGTSTGGIIVTGICVAKRSIDELLELYERLGVFIFGDMSRINSLKFGILAQYGDKGMLDLFLGVCGTKRLDDEDVAASATRPLFAVTTVDISWKPSRARLLRNYGTEDAKGTNRAFVVEAVRATSAAGTFILPLCRNHAPMIVEYRSWTQSISSHYLHTPDTGKIFTNLEYVLSHATLPGDREKLRDRAKNDHFMNDSTLVDGGSWANNPTRVAIIEAKRVFTDENEGVQPFIHAFNFATGDMPAIRNQSWSENQKPAEAAWLGPHGMKRAMTDLIMGSFVDPATETSDTNDQLMEEYKDSVPLSYVCSVMNERSMKAQYLYALKGFMEYAAKAGVQRLRILGSYNSTELKQVCAQYKWMLATTY